MVLYAGSGVGFNHPNYFLCVCSVQCVVINMLIVAAATMEVKRALVVADLIATRLPDDSQRCKYDDSASCSTVLYGVGFNRSQQKLFSVRVDEGHVPAPCKFRLM